VPNVVITLAVRERTDATAKSRPDRNAFGYVTVAEIALAPMMPIPWMLCSRAGCAKPYEIAK
jgi:hypothetical protein